jgi:hypothetical protein
MEPFFFERAAAWCEAIAETLPASCGELAYDKAMRCEERVLNGIRLFSRAAKKWAGYREVCTYLQKSKKDHLRAEDCKVALERLVELKKIDRREDDDGPITRAAFRIRQTKPGPWTGTPARGEPSAEYTQEQMALLEDEQIKREIAEGMRDRWGNLLH